MQPLNAEEPILVTLSGIVILVRLVQYSNARSLISSTGRPIYIGVIFKISDSNFITPVTIYPVCSLFNSYLIQSEYGNFGISVRLI